MINIFKPKPRTAREALMSVMIADKKNPQLRGHRVLDDDTNIVGVSIYSSFDTITPKIVKSIF